MEDSKCYAGAKVQCHLRFNWECQSGCAPIFEGCSQREMGSNFWRWLPLWAIITNVSECFNGVLKGARSLPIMTMVKYTWFKLNTYFDDRRNKSIAQLNSRKKWCKYALDIVMKNKAKVEHHKVTRLSAQQQSYQVDTLHNPRTIGHGDHTHGINLLQRTCTCQEWKLYKIPYVHMLLQFLLGIDMMQSSTLTRAIAWKHCSGAMLPFFLRWKIDYHSWILKKLEGSSLTPDWFERKVTLS